MRLIQLGVINYRAFCVDGLEIDPVAPDLAFHWLNLQNDIIVVAGENNSGKTSLLAAYRDFRSSGFAPSEEDFFGCDTSRMIAMELHFSAEESELDEEQTAKWFSADRVARVRKVWSTVNEKGKKYSYDPDGEAWIENGFGGFDSILQNRLPEPVHIAPDMSSEELKGELQKLFKEIIQRRIAGSANVAAIETSLAALVKEIEDDEYVTGIADKVAAVASDVFPGLSVQIRNPASAKGISALLDKQTDISLTVDGSPALSAGRHGQGSQRALILSTLNVLAPELAAATRRAKTKGASVETLGGVIIQVEEPELFLSPTAVRRMRDLLYRLASEASVQVMACTHSPVMIDFSRPEQTIALVERRDGKATIFQSSNSDAPKNDRDALRLIYQLNPVVAECLFAKKVILVEGDTEFAALTKALEYTGTATDTLDVHIVECSGKGNLPAIQRVLRAFGKRYVVVHDLDTAFSDQAKNPTQWRENEAIWEEIQLARSNSLDALGFVFAPDFEGAHSYTAQKPKLYHAMKMVTERHAAGTFESTQLFALVNAISSWASPCQSIDDVKLL